jgi:hypothetical protein
MLEVDCKQLDVFVTEPGTGRIRRPTLYMLVDRYTGYVHKCDVQFEVPEDRSNSLRQSSEQEITLREEKNDSDRV